MASFEMAELMAEHGAQLGLAMHTQQQSGINLYESIGRHAGIEHWHANDIDSRCVASILTYGIAQNLRDIGLQGWIADDHVGLGKATLLLVHFPPKTLFIHALRLIGPGIRRRKRRFGLGGNARSKGQHADRQPHPRDHGLACAVAAGAAASLAIVLPGKSSSNWRTRFIAPSASRTSPPIWKSAFSHSRSPVLRSTNPA